MFPLPSKKLTPGENTTEAESEHSSEDKLPEHVIKMGHGGYMCASCGGTVGAQGMSEGGEVEDNELTDANGDMHERPVEVGDDSPQMADTERMRAFSKALKG